MPTDSLTVIQYTNQSAATCWRVRLPCSSDECTGSHHARWEQATFGVVVWRLPKQC